MKTSARCCCLRERYGVAIWGPGWLVGRQNGSPLPINRQHLNSAASDELAQRVVSVATGSWRVGKPHGYRRETRPHPEDP